MTGMDKAVYCVVLLVAALSAANGQCKLPVTGTWDILDSSRSKVEATVTFTDTTLSGVTFWDKTLDYDCIFKSGDYYVFSSEQTTLFDLYDVRIYFCWYLSKFSTDTYRVYELTNKVLYTVEQRAKAYLNTTSPTLMDVCEVFFDSALAFKQMQVTVARSDGNEINVSSVSVFICLLFVLFGP